MTKDSGLGDYLYIDGVDVSSGIGKLQNISGGPRPFDTTTVTLDASRRAGAERSGNLHFTTFFDTTLTHPVLSALPVRDVVLTYLRGTAPDLHSAGLLAKQVDYAGTRAGDGSFTLDVDAPTTISDVEWGQTYVGGRVRTDTAATNGVGVDDGDSTIAGLTAFLHVFAPATVTTATVTIQHSNDNGVSDTWSTISGGAFPAVTAVPVASRIEVAAGTTIKRWLRVITTGTFTSLPFFVMIARKAGIGVAVNVQIFTASGTWTKPSGITTTLVAMAAPGGGGGSGAREPSGTATTGGAGGGGGGWMFLILDASSLGATEVITVGAVGVGGAARVSDGFVGQVGTNAGFCRFGTPAKAAAFGGTGGTGGALATITAGGAGGLGGVLGGVGAGANLGAIGLKAPGPSVEAAGGGSGGGIDAVPTAFAGGGGGDAVQLANVGDGAGGAIGVAGGNATTTAPNQAVGGAGGGGGGSSIVAAAGAGGTGGPYGGGGGGGGSSLNGFNSGAGGNGGPGILVAVSW